MPLQCYQKPQGQMGLLGQPHHCWSGGVPHLKIQVGAEGTVLAWLFKGIFNMPGFQRSFSGSGIGLYVKDGMGSVFFFDTGLFTCFLWRWSMLSFWL